jgi:transcriptional regulator with XRE-family HTH domain
MRELGAVSSKRPSNVDKYISRQIRKRREDLQLTQPDLADRAGVSFQQFQKYENGENRVPAGRLFEIARALRANVSFFFPGGEKGEANAARGVAEEGAEFEGPGDSAAADLVRAFKAIDSPTRRKAILAVVQKEAASTKKRKRH